MLTDIKEKAEKNNLQTKLTTRKVDFVDGSSTDRTELFIQIPQERDFKAIIIDNEHENLRDILKSEFEKFKFLRGYEAVYSLEHGIIECEIQSDDIARPSSFLIRRIERFFSIEKKENLKEKETELEEEVTEEKVTLSFPSPNDRIKIFIGESSKEFSILCGLKRDSFFMRRRLRPFQTIRLEGCKIETHDQVKQALVTLGNSVLFQIDLVTNVPMYLGLDRDLQREIRIRRRTTRDDLKLTAPKYQYDSEAMSLYWYARTANNMPLLQYLAFYQVIEFYFPQYSAKEAQQRIKNLLKDPTFDRDSDKNISKILDIVKVTAKGKAIGDERSQIKSTIQYCVDQSDLIQFLNESSDRRDFFDVQKKSKGLVPQKISFDRGDHDIRIDVASRIYDLRCRIVHTKEENDSELLLPFSPDLAYLKQDIDLIEFVAKKVLIAGCKSLELKF